MGVTVRQVNRSDWELAFVTPSPPEAVLDLVVDLRRHAEWETDLTEVTLLGGVPGQRGATYVKRYGTPPRGLLRRAFSTRVEARCTVTEAGPGRIGWSQVRTDHADDGVNEQRLVLSVQAGPDGTHVVLLRRLWVEEALGVRGIAAMERVIGRAAERNPALLRNRPGWDGAATGRAFEQFWARGPGQESLERLSALLG